MNVLGGFGWSGWSRWAMGHWLVGQEMVGVMSYQKIYGVNSEKHHKLDNVQLCESQFWLN